MSKKHRVLGGALVCVVVAAVGCGSDGDESPVDAGAQGKVGVDGGGGAGAGAGKDAATDGKTDFHPPPVAPIVRAATPDALRAPESAELLPALRRIMDVLAPVGTAHADMPTVVDSIKVLFTEKTGVGGGAPGVINAALVELDTRVAGVVQRVATTSKGECLLREPKPYRVDLSSIAPVLDITMNIQCNDNDQILFGNQTSQEFPCPDQDGGADADGGTCGGVGTQYSMWLHMGGDGKDNFGFFANVANADTPDKAVDFLFLEHAADSGERVSAYRVKARPASHRYEFVFGTNVFGAAPQNLKCGFRMISDGDFIVAEGSNSMPGDTCATAERFALCLSALDLSDKSGTAACNKLKSAFTMRAPSGDALDGVGAQFDAALDTQAGVALAQPF